MGGWAFLLLGSSLLAPSPPLEWQDEAWWIRYSAEGGWEVRYRQTLLLERGEIIVHDGAWKSFFFLSRRAPFTSTVRSTAQGTALVVRWGEGEASPFQGEWRVEVGKEGGLRMILNYVWLSQEPARLQYCLGRSPNGLWVGRSLWSDGLPTFFPSAPPPLGAGSRTVANASRTLSWEAPWGRICLEVEGDALTLLDQRQQESAAGYRATAVWLGVVDRLLLPPRSEGYCAVRWSIEPLSPLAAPSLPNPSKPLPGKATPEAVIPLREGLFWRPYQEDHWGVEDGERVTLPWPSASRRERWVKGLQALLGQPVHLHPPPPRGVPLLVPQPQEVRWGEADLLLEPPPSVLLPEGVDARLVRAAQRFAEKAGAFCGGKLAVEVRRAGEGPLPSPSLRVETLERSLEPVPEEVQAFLRQRGEEAYWLLVRPQGVRLVGASAQGAFWGLQTLAQLLFLGPLEEAGLRGVEIRDWPSLAFRGLHLLADKTGATWHPVLIERVLAPLKMNAIVLEVGDTRWAFRPEIAPDWAIEPEELRRIAEIAREHFIEVIPLLPTLGHCHWMFRTPHLLDLAEDPEQPYAYRVGDERTYAFIESILEEVLALFRPRYVHLGHDEFTHRGRFPYRSAAQGLSVAEWFRRDIERLYGFLKGRGVRMMLWADMLLRPGEANDAAHGGPPANTASVRSSLPRDIVLCDWHYRPAPTYPSVGLLSREGFQVLGCAWFEPLNVEAMARSVAEAGAWGLLQTTWTGYGLNHRALYHHYHQLQAYVLAAEYAWSVGQPPLPLLPYDPGDLLAQCLQEEWLRPHRRSGVCVDLAPLCNVRLQGGPFEAQGVGLRGVPTGEVRLGRWLFHIAEHPQEDVPQGILLGNSFIAKGYPREVTLPIARPAAGVVLLGASLWGTELARSVGEVVAEFADGGSQRLPLTYGYNWAAWNDPCATPQAVPVWRQEQGGASATLRAVIWDWEKARPLLRLRFRTTSPDASPLLLGCTLLDEMPREEALTGAAPGA